MKLILQSHDSDCLAACVAMTLDLSLKEIYDFVGHNGRAILWPNLDGPEQRRGFIFPELLPLYLVNMTYPVEIWKETEHGPEPTLKHNNVELIHKAMSTRPGIVFIDGKHCLAWCHNEKMAFDPIGFKIQIENLDNVDLFIALY